MPIDIPYIYFNIIRAKKEKEHMNKIAIFGDSTCDLTTEVRKQRNIDYVRMHVSWKDKEKKEHEIYASLDWEVYSPKQYYDLMRNGAVIFTSQVSEQEFDEKFLPHLKDGEDILYIACSSALSQSVNLAVRLVSEKYSKEYPNSKIVVIDSLCSCMGQGSMLLRAADLRDAGKSIEEIAEDIEKNKLRYNQIATVEDLSTLAKHGRVKAAKAFFGNIFGVKPMIISDAKGNNYAVEKAKGRRNALLRAVEVVKERVIEPEKQICYVSHADAKAEDVELVVSKLKELNFKEVRVGDLGPIISASCGPATFGIYYYGQEETRIGD